MAKAKTAPDPVFAAYAASAPRLDLRFYLDYASRHEADWSLETGQVINDMAALYIELSKPKPKIKGAAAKRAVWSLIDRYKASIRGWAGNAGSPTSPDRYYFDVLAQINACYHDVPALTEIERSILAETPAESEAMTA